MGQIVIPIGTFAYVDSAVLIYKIERCQPFMSVAAPLWEALYRETIEICTSELTYLEVMVKPVKLKDSALITCYRAAMFNALGFYLIPITWPIWDTAITLRAVYNLKTPDAIHAATALLNHCGLFVTNDPIFKRVPGLNAVVLTDLL